METRTLVITSSALAHGRLSVKDCGRDFFPPDAFGQPSRGDGVGRPIRLRIDGFPEPVETDLPTDRAGRPRWFFRARGWVKTLVRDQNLTPGDRILIAK